MSVSFEIHNMAIMKDTLTEMGIKFSEKNEVLEIMKSRYPISINSTTGEITFDSDQQQEVNKIKVSYMENFYRDRAIREGMKVTKQINAQGEIELYLTN